MLAWPRLLPDGVAETVTVRSPSVCVTWTGSLVCVTVAIEASGTMPFDPITERLSTWSAVMPSASGSVSTAGSGPCSVRTVPMGVPRRARPMN